MNRVEVAKIPIKRVQPLEILAEFCYFYPQYTLAEARELPEVHVRTLLNKAQQIRAANYMTLTQIAAAPHSDKGKAVGKLISHFERIAKNG